MSLENDINHMIKEFEDVENRKPQKLNEVKDKKTIPVKELLEKRNKATAPTAKEK